MSEKPKLTMIVVDDEEGPRTSIRMVFKNEFNVQTFSDGDLALEWARQNPIHIAILDIRMAGKTGIEILQGLKHIDQHIEVIMLTAYETLDTAKQALRLGAADYLNKPFDLTTIREAVGRAIRLRQISENVSVNADRLNQLSEQLNDAFSREEMTRTANEIYAGVIHDLNNPLTIISGFVEILQNRLARASTLAGRDLDSVRENLAAISRQVKTCCAIASRYLRVMRRVANDTDWIAVNQILSDLEALVRSHPSLGSSRIEITQLENDMAAAVNATDLIQILLNIVVNALQSTDKAQVVRIGAVLQSQPCNLAVFANKSDEIYFGSDTFANTAPLVSITVQDEGSGISPEILPKILETYFTTKEPGKGTGLGLSIVTRLVKASHGCLRIKTRPGEGTTMTVWFPAHTVPAAEPEPSGST
ncbi:MAG TPA: hybrid sensor histidine kinase/response regulator [Opitutaceae bacterium]|nr:hybrid sensor histidine kinase/response regulator [Opitutaceae bacterium]